jgi:hypothetical protein
LLGAKEESEGFGRKPSKLRLSQYLARKNRINNSLHCDSKNKNMMLP